MITGTQESVLVSRVIRVERVVRHACLGTTVETVERSVPVRTEPPVTMCQENVHVNLAGEANDVINVSVGRCINQAKDNRDLLNRRYMYMRKLGLLKASSGSH